MSNTTSKQADLDSLFLKHQADADSLLYEFMKVDPDSLVEFIGTVEIPAMAEKFVVKDRFIKDTSDSALVKIHGFSGNFEKWFLGKIEKSRGETILRCQKLQEGSLHYLIIDKLGGEKKAETALAEMFDLMKRQRNGEKGRLLVSDSRVNIFYILDSDGVLRSVSCHWFDDGWFMRAFPIDGLRGWWVGGYHNIFSRNFSELISLNLRAKDALTL